MAKVRNARADHFHVWRVTAHAPEFRLRMCIFLRMRTGCLVLTSDTTSVVDEVKVFFFSFFFLFFSSPLSLGRREREWALSPRFVSDLSVEVQGQVKG